jgi:hypothetical protein
VVIAICYLPGYTGCLEKGSICKRSRMKHSGSSPNDVVNAVVACLPAIHGFPGRSYNYRADVLPTLAINRRTKKELLSAQSEFLKFLGN